MERLPYIDEYSTTVAVSKDDTWSAVLQVMCGNPDEPARAPIGFVVDEAIPGQRLALRGRHWFAAYRLVFILDEVRDGDVTLGTRVHAQTWAVFPGVKGRIYRTLVIGSRGHRVAVWSMLNRIAAQARQRPIRSVAAG
jgi:hypothetical protein